MVERIFALMEANAISQYKLAKEIGLPTSIFTNWKNGKASPSSQVIVKLAQYFNVTTDFLLGLEPPKEQVLTAQETELLTEFRKLKAGITRKFFIEIAKTQIALCALNDKDNEKYEDCELVEKMDKKGQKSFQIVSKK